MSRLAKAKAATLRAKKDRNRPRLSPEAAQEATARARVREWKQRNPARPMYAMLDESVATIDAFVSVLSHMADRRA